MQDGACEGCQGSQYGVRHARTLQIRPAPSLTWGCCRRRQTQLQHDLKRAQDYAWREKQIDHLTSIITNRREHLLIRTLPGEQPLEKQEVRACTASPHSQPAQRHA